MRVITWNCKQNFRKKYSDIEFFNPDILVIPECESLDKINFKLFKNPPTDSYWIGENQNKGLGVFTFNNFKISLYKNYNEDFKYILPLIVSNNNETYNLIGVWTQKIGPKKKNHINYIRQFKLSMEVYKPFLNFKNVIICGDFNSNLIWENPFRIDKVHKEVVDDLEEMNIFSSYHNFFNEEQGKESIPTYYHTHNKKKPFHIDYCFLSKNLLDKVENVRIGEYDNYIEKSDHLPIYVTIS
jgi:exonuclease III